MHNLLVDPLIRVRRPAGAIDTLSLPAVYAALAVDGVAAFPALRPHQRHAWHALLAQLAVIAMHRGDAAAFPETASEWRTLLRGLTRAFDDDEPWRLVVADQAQPAFMQCPAPRGLESYRTLKTTPDDLDLLITSRNHEQKRSITIRSQPDDWIFALIDAQTMSGFSGPGNYGVARMNGGLSSWPCLGFAPAGVGPGAHLAHDVHGMLAGRGPLVERHAFAPDNGLALLWLHPWDGNDAVSLRMLDPYFIEICRRIRLVAAAGHVVARTAAAKMSRIDSKAAHGDVGDFWTPVPAEDGKALSISAASFRYDRLTALLTDARRAPPLNVNTAKSPRWRLVARGMAGGRGRTGGYHERTDLTFAAETVEAWLGQGRSDALLELAAAQIAEVREALLALQFAAAVAKSGGRATEALTAADRQRGYACTKRLEDAADARFFPALEARFLARDDAEAARHRLEFVRGLISTAEELLAKGLDVGPCSALQRPRARAQAGPSLSGSAAARGERLPRPDGDLRRGRCEAAADGTCGPADRSRPPRPRCRGPRAGIPRGAAAGGPRRDRAPARRETAGGPRASRHRRLGPLGRGAAGNHHPDAQDAAPQPAQPDAALRGRPLRGRCLRAAVGPPAHRPGGAAARAPRDSVPPAGRAQADPPRSLASGAMHPL